MASPVDICGALPDKVRHWYLCGPDRGFVAAALHEIRPWLGCDASRVEYMDAEHVTTQQVAEFLAGAGSLPGEGPALLVLENADALDLSFLMKHKSSVWTERLLAIGGESTAASASPQHSYFFKRQCAKAVVCKTPPTQRQAVWVQKRLSCGTDVAIELVKCSGGDTVWLAQEVQKLAALDVGPQLQVPHIYKVTSPTAQGDVVAMLLAGSRKAALDCLPSRQAAPTAFRRLEEMVLKGSLLYEAQGVVGWASRPLTKRTGLGMAEIGTLKEHVNTFARQPTERRLRVLARVSSRALQGDRQAWLVLVALW